MKRFVYPLAFLALNAHAASAEVELSGFIDMSFFSDDGDKSLSLDQLELNIASDVGDGISVRADLNALSGDVVLEQAYIAYNTGTGWGLTAGKFLSCTGWEAAEPTGMYQYSYSATLVYGGYQHGVAASYSSDAFGLYGPVVASVWNGDDTDYDNLGIEAQLTLTPVRGLTAKAALAWEDGFEHATQDEPFDRTLVNIWAAYEAGPLTVAAELNGLRNWEDGDGLLYEEGGGLLAMVHYGLSDKVGVTARVSGMVLRDDAIEQDYEVSEFTIAPNYALADNWGLVAELKMLSEGDADAVAQIALESLLTF